MIVESWVERELLVEIFVSGSVGTVGVWGRYFGGVVPFEVIPEGILCMFLFWKVVARVVIDCAAFINLRRVLLLLEIGN